MSLAGIDNNDLPCRDEFPSAPNESASSACLNQTNAIGRMHMARNGHANIRRLNQFNLAGNWQLLNVYFVIHR
jgi:hypothetical protein